jgi:hypothetical protein
MIFKAGILFRILIIVAVASSTVTEMSPEAVK